MNGRSRSEHRTMNESGHSVRKQQRRRFHRREVIRSRSLKNATLPAGPELPSRSRSLNNRLARHQLEKAGWNDTFGINVFDLDPNDNSNRDHSSNTDLDFGADWQDDSSASFHDDNTIKDSSSKEELILKNESLSSHMSLSRHVRRGLSQRKDALRRTSSRRKMDESGHKNNDDSTRRRRRSAGRKDRSTRDKTIEHSPAKGESQKRGSTSSRRKEELRRSSSTSPKVERTEMKQ